MEIRRAEWTVLAGAALVIAGCSKTVDHSCADRAAELATWADEVAREGHPFSIAALVDASSASPRPDRIGSMAVMVRVWPRLGRAGHHLRHPRQPR